jgi:ubiquinone/menaquinone biosynthesis C-methylase UbiE
MTFSNALNTHSDQPYSERTINRLRAQTLLSWEKERRMLERWGLQDGMTVLEVGSGPGFITERLLGMLPTTAITAVEIEPGFIRYAESHLAGKMQNRLRILEASIMNTGLPEKSFDFAVARFVFQHLPEPIKATKEIRRLLKPGGKLVIIDSDDAIFGIVHPPIPGLQNILERLGEAQAQQGGNRQIGRQLWRILKAAGFQNLDLEAIAFHSDELGIEAFQQHLDPERLLPLVKRGLITEQELADAYASYEQFLANPHHFILMLWLMVCGEKSVQ